MKLDSKYFDSIRISKPGKEPPEKPRAAIRCQWKGCQEPGAHRAPKGRGRDGEYYALCQEHVRAYNASYNYFEGMSQNEIEEFRKDAITGHRPTWKMGQNMPHEQATGTRTTRNGHRKAGKGFADPFGFFPEDAADTERPGSPRRHLHRLERKSLEALGLDQSAGKAEVKARFKQLVKRHHPDANGGDKAAEEKLREVIQAYNYLKQAGLV